MSRNLRVFLVVTAFLVTSIVLVSRDDFGTDTAEIDARPDVHGVDPDDPEMNAAMARARSTVDGFVRRLPGMRFEGAFFTIKVPLTENGETEHVWINEPEFDGERFTGYIASVPVSLASWSYGDRVTVALDGISDWVAVANGTLYGGFTLHVLRPRMTPEEQQALYEGLGTRLPDNPIVWD